jgi:hypothetical protein
MPVSVMRHHQVTIDGETSRPATTRFSIAVAERSVDVAVGGPRFAGRRTVAGSECAEVVLLQVYPLPAQLIVQCPYAGMTLECPDCPGPAGERIHLAGDFPPIPVEAMETEVEILFRAPGYRRVWRSISLVPGLNRVRVKLEANDAAG